MCGIIGTIGTVYPKDVFDHARDTQASRGLDDAGTYYDAKTAVALGHRRLSVIDVTQAGHQPFVSADGQYILVYNGEIYNYIEIREKLKNTYHFKTETDTEVLLAAYIRWGKKCLKHFNGMFAFAIWDTKEKELFCARDRLGIKPFFYFYDNGAFIFSSEIKSLLALGIKADPSEEVIFDYLYYGLYDHGEKTFFRNIITLEPGHFLLYKNKKISIHTYWDCADAISQNESHHSEEETKETFVALLSDSIRLRFRSDVPVGVGLSSGLDSNSLLYYANKVTAQTIPALSACNQDSEYDECRVLSRTLDQKQKKSWHCTYCTARAIFSSIDEMNKTQDQPFGGLPTIAKAKVYELAKHLGITVLLEGQGVDEILAGYKYYTIEYQKDVDKTVAIKNSDLGRYGNDLSIMNNHSLLDAKFIKKFKERKIVFPQPSSSYLINAQYRDIRYTKLPRVLRLNDHASMAYGREVRVPFLDHRIVEFCLRLPAWFKINHSRQKILLRDVMDPIIPKQINKAPKKAFVAIQSEWFKTCYQKEIETLLADDRFKGLGYWNQKALREKVNDLYSGKVNNSFFLWQCVNLNTWFKCFINQ